MQSSYRLSGAQSNIITDRAVIATAAEFLAAWTEAGVELLGCILSEPRRGVELAHEAGLAVHHFCEVDQRLIWMAAEAGAAAGKVTVLHRARHVLGERDLWTERAPPSRRGPVWSAQTLAALAVSWPGPSQTPALARRVIDLEQRYGHAQAAMRRCVEAMEGAVPDGPPRVMMIVRRPRRWKGGRR